MGSAVRGRAGPVQPRKPSRVATSTRPARRLEQQYFAVSDCADPRLARGEGSGVRVARAWTPWERSRDPLRQVRPVPPGAPERPALPRAPREGEAPAGLSRAQNEPTRQVARAGLELPGDLGDARGASQRLPLEGDSTNVS